MVGRCHHDSRVNEGDWKLESAGGNASYLYRNKSILMKCTKVLNLAAVCAIIDTLLCT